MDDNRRKMDESPTIPYTELPEDKDSPIATESNVYRREVGRLLAEGHQGKWILIKACDIIGIYDSRAEAKAVAIDRYLMQSVLIRQVLAREPLIRGPLFFRVVLGCSFFLDGPRGQFTLTF